MIVYIFTLCSGTYFVILKRQLKHQSLHVIQGKTNTRPLLSYQLTRVLTSSQHVARATERILDKSQALMTLTEKLKMSIQGSVVSV